MVPAVFDDRVLDGDIFVVAFSVLFLLPSSGVDRFRVEGFLAHGEEVLPVRRPLKNETPLFIKNRKSDR